MATSDGATPGAGTEGRPRLLETLKQDHRALLDSFNELQQCDKGERHRILELFNKIALDFQMHMEGEERFLYTALERHQEVRSLVLESFEEHHLVRKLITALQTLAFDDERWGARVAVLRRVTEAHVAREEGVLFDAAVKVLRGEEMQRIWEQIQRLKREKTAA